METDLKVYDILQCALWDLINHVLIQLVKMISNLQPMNKKHCSWPHKNCQACGSILKLILKVAAKRGELQSTCIIKPSSNTNTLPGLASPWPTCLITGALFCLIEPIGQ